MYVYCLNKYLKLFLYVAYFEYSLFWRQWADVLSDEADKDSGYEDLSRYPDFIHIIQTLSRYPH